MLLAVPVRDVDDRCPGVLRPFAAADGAIVRLRVPGGRVSSHDLVTVCDLAERFGQPFVQLTSRGNLQLRGLDEPLPGAFVDAVAAPASRAEIRVAIDADASWRAPVLGHIGVRRSPVHDAAEVAH